jgi:hypothetical protein
VTKAELLQEELRLTLLHHDAFLVEFLGAQKSGLSAARIGELFDAGLISEDAMEGMKIGTTDLDPFEFIAVAGAKMDEASPQDRKKMREWGVEQWLPHVKVKVEDLRSMTREEAEERKDDGVLSTVPPLEITASPSIEPPSWMSPAEAAGYERAVLRGGEYIRGLGNILHEDLDKVVGEVWAGEQIAQEADATKRQERLAQVREELATSLATKRDARALAGALADRTEHYAHNWKRIATTELQGAHNEGRISYALRAYGDSAQVARIPETDACDYCREAFAPEGAPKVFRAAELLGNGTNVGRTRAQWQPTAWPMHPNCRCDTIAVPFGFKVAEDGTIVREDQE